MNCIADSGWTFDEAASHFEVQTIPRNPEQDVIDRIDALVDESLAHGPTDDYEREWLARCELCHGEWHGLPSFGCPGAFATDEQRERWNTRYTVRCNPPSTPRPRYAFGHAEPIDPPLHDVAAAWSDSSSGALWDVPYDDVILAFQRYCENDVRCGQCRRYLGTTGSVHSGSHHTILGVMCEECFTSQSRVESWGPPAIVPSNPGYTIADLQQLREGWQWRPQRFSVEVHGVVYTDYIAGVRQHNATFEITTPQNSVARGAHCSHYTFDEARASFDARAVPIPAVFNEDGTVNWDTIRDNGFIDIGTIDDSGVQMTAYTWLPSEGDDGDRLAFPGINNV